ncbi:unnamed protein product [Ectocarpus sp. CCAP 1310/34]|nr:unnamed protein product [Ectocarpus sp. CCAP 1310/34]
MTAENGSAEAVVKSNDVAKAVWAEIVKLRDEIPPPPAGGLYPDDKAAKAFQAADAAVASLCGVPREQMLEGFTQLVEGSRLNDLLNALVASEGHPALQHSCLMVLCGVASLQQAHVAITERRDVLQALLKALASPTAHQISPEGSVGEDDLQINPSVGSAICLNSLLVSCGGLGEDTIKVWQELDALSAITSALESHAVFEGGGDEDVLPAMLFGLATPLLTNFQQQQRARQELEQQQKQQQQASAASKATPPAGEQGGETATPPPDTASKKEGATAGAGAVVDAEADKASRAARQRLAEAFLRLLAERREWVARSLAMAANASPTDLSGGGATAAAPVTINNLLVNSLAHADLLGAFTRLTPVRLRAQAVAAARQCETDGTFAPGFGAQLAQLLGLGGQQELNRRMAGRTVQKIKNKEAARAANIMCARPACGKRQGNASGGAKFKVCSRCQVAMYCSGECQKAHWKTHKMECRQK